VGTLGLSVSAHQLAGLHVDEVNLRTSRAIQAFVLVFRHIVSIAKPMLDVELGLRTDEEDRTAHAALRANFGSAPDQRTLSYTWRYIELTDRTRTSQS